MPDSPFVEFYCRLQRILDRYAIPGQGELFNKDQGQPAPATEAPNNFPGVERKPTHQYRERVEIFPHKRDASGSRALRDELKARPNAVAAKIEDAPGGGTAIRVLSGQRTSHSPQPTGTHEPSFTTEAPLATQHGAQGLDLGPRPAQMMPEIHRDPAYHWMEQSTVLPTRDSAESMLAEHRHRVGFHDGEIVPAGQMFRVNRLYRFPRVMYK